MTRLDPYTCTPVELAVYMAPLIEACLEADKEQIAAASAATTARRKPPAPHGTYARAVSKTSRCREIECGCWQAYNDYQRIYHTGKRRRKRKVA